MKRLVELQRIGISTDNNIQTRTQRIFYNGQDRIQDNGGIDCLSGMKTTGGGAIPLNGNAGFQSTDRDAGIVFHVALMTRTQQSHHAQTKQRRRHFPDTMS
jgi:hypothetical protein